MVATYIEELLATNNRVIVPNFGAFLVRATSKSKDANTLEEKLKDIYFSPFLKFNDELLEKHIVKKEGVTKEEAAEKIKDFIEKVKKELDEDKPFIIKGFGRFEADKQGKVQFVTVAKEEKETPAGKKAPEATKAETTKKTPPAKKPEATKPSEKVTGDKPKTEEQKKPAPVAKEEIKTPESKLKEYQDDKKETVTTTTEKTKTTVSSKEKKPIYSYKKEKKPVNKGLVWAIAIGLPVAAIFIWGLLNFNTVKKVFNKEKQKTEKAAKSADSKKATKKTQQDTQKETTQKKQTADKTAQATEKNKQDAAPAKKETKPAPPQKKYYIIAGSFKNEKYAISFMNKLKAEGYNAEKLAERNGMHAVSYSSFADKQKALAEYRFLSQEKGLQTWILYY